MFQEQYTKNAPNILPANEVGALVDTCIGLVSSAAVTPPPATPSTPSPTATPTEDASTNPVAVTGEANMDTATPSAKKTKKNKKRAMVRILLILL